MSAITFTESEEGKRVVNTQGEEIGVVADVKGGVAHIDPDPSAFDTVKSKLGWGDAGEDTYPLDATDVQAVTDDEVRLA